MTSSRFQPRAHLAAYALLSFIIAFTVARVFTTFFPSTVIFTNGIHIHHFWFGLALLAIGGWIGISYNDNETNRLAAILYGIGGGLIVDEVGLLLTFGDYRTEITFTFLVVMLAFIFVLIILNAYRQAILEELREFVRSRASLYFGVFLFSIAIAFIAETTDNFVIAISTLLAVAAISIIAVFFILRIRAKRKKLRQPNVLQLFRKLPKPILNSI